MQHIAFLILAKGMLNVIDTERCSCLCIDLCAASSSFFFFFLNPSTISEEENVRLGLVAITPQEKEKVRR